MDIAELTSLAETRVRYLTEQRREFVRLGDVESITRVEAELAETQNTLLRLQVGAEAVFNQAPK